MSFLDNDLSQYVTCSYFYICLQMRSFDFIVSVIGDTDDDWNIKMEKIVVEKFGKLKCEDRILWQCREQVVTFRIETNGTSCPYIPLYDSTLYPPHSRATGYTFIRGGKIKKFHLIWTDLDWSHLTILLPFWRNLVSFAQNEIKVLVIVSDKFTERGQGGGVGDHAHGCLAVSVKEENLVCYFR